MYYKLHFGAVMGSLNMSKPEVSTLSQFIEEALNSKDMKQHESFELWKKDIMLALTNLKYLQDEML
jgi:hypothetical protein